MRSTTHRIDWTGSCRCIKCGQYFDMIQDTQAECVPLILDAVFEALLPLPGGDND
jgi:hypothetical protein